MMYYMAIKVPVESIVARSLATNREVIPARCAEGSEAIRRNGESLNGAEIRNIN
jgi:hypothetical protein